MSLQLLQVPHVIRNLVKALVVSHSNLLTNYGVICEMTEKVTNVFGVIVLAAESHVAVLVVVDCEWVPI